MNIAGTPLIPVVDLTEEDGAGTSAAALVGNAGPTSSPMRKRLRGLTRDTNTVPNKPEVKYSCRSQRSCPICLEIVGTGRATNLECGHFFCAECLHRHVCTVVNDAGRLPSCPCSHEGCEHRISEVEVRDLLALCQALCGNTVSIAAQQRTLQRYLTLERHHGLSTMGAFPCPSCEAWLVVNTAEPSQPQRIDCPYCPGDSFCSGCLRRPYHHRCSCEEVPSICSKWYEFAKAQHASSSSEKQAREEDHMEKWKVLHCRRCPKCGRVVEKLGGCNRMQCGQDAHGGNVQNGCGHRFRWSDAPVDGQEVAASGLVAPFPTAWTSRWLMLGQAQRCDACHEEIVGPRFDCIDCAIPLEICVVCAKVPGHLTALLANRSAARFQGSGTSHRADHVFRIRWPSPPRRDGNALSTDFRLHARARRQENQRVPKSIRRAARVARRAAKRQQKRLAQNARRAANFLERQLVGNDT